ncbi:MAG: hypothetical protein J1E34_02965, partial [Oscillospiraceae bacterium]|nr:hypothetical protein [Oscillospiraceae bacterium]
MTKAKKIIAVILAVTMLAVCFLAPVSAAATSSGSVYSFGEKIEHFFYKFVDKLIGLLGKTLNLFIPGFSWTDSIPRLSDYTFSGEFMGENEFDTTVYPEAEWSMGFADASLIDGLDIFDGSYYVAGSLEVINGRTPTELIDDQTVNVYAISDGVSGTVVHVVIDGYGIARGDVLKIRESLKGFAELNDIISINISVLHQHSCIDTLGLSAPILPALVKNPLSTLKTTLGDNSLSGKNDKFMQNLFAVVNKTVETAVGNMTAGSLYYGSADIEEFIHDKREPIVYDEEIHRLRFVPYDENSNEIWVCQAAIHCVGFGAAASVVSSDYPYYIKNYVKEQTGADVVFVEGAELALTADYTTLTYDNSVSSSKLEAMGKAIGDRLISISNETELDPVLNIKINEIKITADNQILILAVREGLVNSVVTKDASNYYLMTELGYMELG